jgi:hypothetical protein
MAATLPACTSSGVAAAKSQYLKSFWVLQSAFIASKSAIQV